MYLDGDDGLYFYDYDGNDYTDSYSKNVLFNHDFGDDQYFLIYGHDDSGYGAVGRIFYSPQGSETLSQYYGNGSLTFYVKPGDSMKNTANLSPIMPDMLYRMVGSDSKALLRVLGVDQEMLDWLSEKQDGGEYAVLYELFGRSDPVYRETSTYRYIKFSRFVEGTDGGTVNVSVTIFLPDEGQGFSRAWIEYTYY